MTRLSVTARRDVRHVERRAWCLEISLHGGEGMDAAPGPGSGSKGNLMRNEEIGLLRQLAGPPKPKKSLVQKLNELRENKLAPPPQGLGALLFQPIGDDDDD
jgi:hypothetical protein